MGRITTGIGLVSGINSKDIIEQLMALEARPKDTLQTRIDSITQQKLAYTDLQTRLTGIKLSGTTLKKPSTFQNAATSSSDEDVLTATAASSAAVGSFQFQVSRLVTSQQSVSRGFVDFDSAKLGAGTLTIEAGGGELTRQDMLSELRGGAGVRRGQFKITDRSGATAVIDTTAAVTLDDVVKKINTNLDISVRASLDGDNIVIADTTGKTTSNLIVQDIGDGHAAEDLGIVQSTNTNTLTGTDINYLGRLTSLSQTNDGRGVRTASTGADFRITLGNGSTVDVTLAGKKTIGDVIDSINTAGGSNLKAEIVAGSNGIRISDMSGGGGAFSIAALNSSKAATDLGIETTGAGGIIDGGPVLAGLGTVLLGSLNGGSGVTLGTISIQSRAAGAATDVNLASAKTVADVINAINNAGVGVKASLNASENGLQITDTSGGSGNLVISGIAAATLGLNGTFDINTTVARGANLQRQWVSENTLLSDYNGGKGVTPGKFKITNSTGASATIDLTQGNEIRLQDVISEINSKGINVTASINATGDGLLLTDTAGGTQKMKVENVDGTTATDLNIKGSAAGTTINGSFEKTIAVTATDTLQTIQTKINDLNWGVTASIINDGSSLAPFRLALNAKNSGHDGRIVFDAGATTLETRTLVEAQDAAVFVGGATGDQPLLITASRNQLSGVIKGVNVELHGVSDKPVTLNVTRNIDNVVEEVGKFVQNFNDMVDKIKDLTKFDTDTNTRGLLLGEVAVQTVQTQMYAMLSTVNGNAGRYRTLGDVGIHVGDGAKVTFDEDKFREAYGTDSDAVEKLFTSADQTVTPTMSLTTLNNGKGIGLATSGPDMRAVLLDGTKIDINLSTANTIGDVIDIINAAGGAKLKASLNADGSLKLSDSTHKAGPNSTFVISSYPTSTAKSDLGLSAVSSGGVITGSPLSGLNKSNAAIGIGAAIEKRVSSLIDPVDGTITRQNKQLDQRTEQFQDRMDALDKLLEQKRTRLEKQFANLESVLSGLQSQQQAIGQIQSIKLPS
jgi:flagellar hook-associated protein 2